MNKHDYGTERIWRVEKQWGSEGHPYGFGGAYFGLKVVRGGNLTLQEARLLVANDPRREEGERNNRRCRRIMDYNRGG
jgi:hypothetical protein